MRSVSALRASRSSDDGEAASAPSRAAVLTEPGRIEVTDVEVPPPSAGEVVVRLEGCGVCSSNLGPWEGAPWFDYPWAPGAPGHEGWGVVERVGRGVHTIAPGDRVATLSANAYATHVVAPATECVTLPRELDHVPFPGEPLGCAVNILERSGITPGDVVGVVGIGFLGALVTQLAVLEGARVIALSRRPYAREVGRSCGATFALDASATDEALAAVEDDTQGALCDVVVEATGKQAPLDLAARLTRVRGRLIVAGYHQDGPRRVDMRLWNWRGLDVINAHERDPRRNVHGVRRAVRAVVDGRIDLAPLLTHEYPLDQLDRALDATRERPDGFLKAVVRP